MKSPLHGSLSIAPSSIICNRMVQLKNTFCNKLPSEYLYLSVICIELISEFEDQKQENERVQRVQKQKYRFSEMSIVRHQPNCI